MKKIRNYNPDLGFTLNDIKALLILEEADDYCGNHSYNLLDSVCQSVEENTTYSYDNSGIQRVYDILMERASSAVEDYERQLIEQGYTQEDINEYHKERRRANNGKDF